MTPSISNFDQFEEAFAVRTRRETTTSRPPRRESPRFAKRRGKQGSFDGSHRRSLKPRRI